MSKWREIRYYENGNPTKTTKRLRRRHLFKAISKYTEFTHRSRCGYKINAVQMSAYPSDAQKCGHCLKILAGEKIGEGERPGGKLRRSGTMERMAEGLRRLCKAARQARQSVAELVQVLEIEQDREKVEGKG